MAETTNQPKKLRITYVKSAIGYSERHKATIRALGLRRCTRRWSMRILRSVRGMLAKVNHLVRIEEV